MPVASDKIAREWFTARGWKPFPFQRDVWRAMQEGRSGLLHATTGSGKTYAAWLGALQAFALRKSPRKSSPGAKKESPVKSASASLAASKHRAAAPPLTVLWITPMRALAADTLRALTAPLTALAPDWTTGLRTGDTASTERAAQDRRLPTVLVTTPESLSLLLARADAYERLKSVQLVVVDEWHELLGNKRGVQVQLGLARLSTWNPKLMVWGMSATLGNLEEALATLVPVSLSQGSAPDHVLVQGRIDKALEVDVLLPAHMDRFAWAGHMGLSLVPQVVARIEAAASTLVFTNTRSQSERWYQALLDARPDWAGAIGLHHGSLDAGVRAWVEAGLKGGSLRAVVCTSSLDLGVDFLPVDQVLQIGSAKGVARLLQRAGRSGHAPGRRSRVTLVPTHSLELVEAAGVRHAIAHGQIESRHSPHAPLDVLVQHLVTIGLGGGFEPDALLAEVRRAYAYRNLSDASWQWALAFVRQGGESLTNYPDFSRVQPDDAGIWRVPDARLARRHRSNIGTIVSDASLTVQYLKGPKLGSVEESFLSRLQTGDVFTFAGRLLKLVRIEQMTAWVRRATSGAPAVPRWGGGRLPISETLGHAMLEELAKAGRGDFDSPEMKCVQPLLALQAAWSALPSPGALVAETLQTREGWHLFLYPFAGRLVHQGLAGLLAWRGSQHTPNTFSIAVNDYGPELLSAREIDWAALLPGLLANNAETPDTLAEELLQTLNATEMARRRFREIARIAGLIFQSHPGEQRSNRQIQASASLYYDVFARYDPHNLLLVQARTELLSEELDAERLAHTLAHMRTQTLALCPLTRPTPFALPLMVERFRERLSTETLADRLARMVEALEKAANATMDAAGDGAKPRRRSRKLPAPTTTTTTTTTSEIKE